MLARLRHHHLLCLLTFAGKGYDPAFTANLRRIAERAAAGEAFRLVAGPDDVCAALVSQASPHCLRGSVRSRDEEAARSLSALLDHPLPVGSIFRFEASETRTMRQAFASGTARRACTGCEWFDLCSNVASGAFNEAVL